MLSSKMYNDGIFRCISGEGAFIGKKSKNYHNCRVFQSHVKYQKNHIIIYPITHTWNTTIMLTTDITTFHIKNHNWIQLLYLTDRRLPMSIYVYKSYYDVYQFLWIKINKTRTLTRTGKGNTCSSWQQRTQKSAYIITIVVIIYLLF